MFVKTAFARAPSAAMPLLARSAALQPPSIARQLSTTRTTRTPTTTRIAGLQYAKTPQSTADAVSNIIYKTPTAQKTSHHVHVLNCFMQDEPGILTRATGIMAARGYNIDSVVVSRTEIAGLSRMTITVNGEQHVVQQARKQLEDLPQVWAVVDLTDAKVVEREVLLMKLSTIGPDHSPCAANSCTPKRPLNPETTRSRERHIKEILEVAGEELSGSGDLPHVRVMETSQRLGYIRSLAGMFGAKIVDVGAECCIVELCAKSERVDAFMKIAKPFGILEAARTGRMAMSRAAKLSLYEDDAPEAAVEQQQAPDLSSLPPS